MIEFKGFPARMQFTPVPNLVFSSLLPQITDITELKVLLHIFEIIYPKKGSLRFASFNELLGHTRSDEQSQGHSSGDAASGYWKL